MDKNNSESNNTSNTVDYNEAANSKDCDTNSEHSSIMNDSIHSSQNNRYENYLYILWNIQYMRKSHLAIQTDSLVIC